MTGGTGDDIFVIDDVTGPQLDTVTELAGEGNDTVAGAITLSLAGYANVENVQLVGNGNINATGNAGDNVLTGNAGNNALTGGIGNDTIDGGASGTDTAIFNGTVLASSFDLNAAGSLVVSGPDGVDTLTAIDQVQFGANVLTVRLGTNGANTLAGGAGVDLVVGGDGADNITAGQGNDVIFAGAGNDTIRWGVTAGGTIDGRDFVNGGAEPVGGIGDTFIVNGNNQSEVFRVYSNTDDWDLNAANGIVSSAAHAGLTGLAATTEIVITRNTNGLGGAVTNANIVAELTDIEEIVINTNGGTNFVVPVGEFSETHLSSQHDHRE